MLKKVNNDLNTTIKLIKNVLKKDERYFDSCDEILYSEKPIKIFLSHNMSGLDKEHVMNIRNAARKYLDTRYGNYTNIIYIDNYSHKDAPENANRLWHLGKSIQQLSEADYVHFCNPRSNSAGCIIEKLICLLYRIPVLK